jgi:two-component system chemotaxis response regulator CheB
LKKRIRMVAVGASWGGLEAIGRLLAGLPPGFPAAVVVVQHRGSATPDGVMRHYLEQRCHLEVIDAEDKLPLEDGRVYLGPPDYHLLVDDGILGLSLEAPVAYSRPSVDVLFESAADSYGPDLAAVVLTGANDDGSRGVVAVKRAGGTVLVQDPEQAERREMPDAAIATGAIDGVYGVEDLAACLTRLVCAG